MTDWPLFDRSLWRNETKNFKMLQPMDLLPGCRTQLSVYLSSSEDWGWCHLLPRWITRKNLGCLVCICIQTSHPFSTSMYNAILGTIFFIFTIYMTFQCNWECYGFSLSLATISRSFKDERKWKTGFCQWRAHSRHSGMAPAKQQEIINMISTRGRQNHPSPKC